MGFRIVKINTRCKLETQIGYLVYRAEEEKKILLDDIDLLIIENQQVCITTALITELINHKVRVVFCDSKHNPEGEISPYSSCYDTSAKIKFQIGWSSETKDLVWQWIVRHKIRNQAMILKKVNKEETFDLLNRYRDEVKPGDTENREGLAAKAYFAAIFGSGFDRRKDSDNRNTYLNYGYSLLLSAVNQSISEFGYLNPLGIHHIGSTNPFNLGCDFMEPWRPFIDMMIVKNIIDIENYKSQLLKLLSSEVIYGEKTMIFENAVHEYVMDLLSALKEGTIVGMKEIHFQDEQL
ncbi:MAG: type II CRISPR-associated endonuclease Cas1 [Bacilli bacterium]